MVCHGSVIQCTRYSLATRISSVGKVLGKFFQLLSQPDKLLPKDPPAPYLGTELLCSIFRTKEAPLYACPSSLALPIHTAHAPLSRYIHRLSSQGLTEIGGAL